jgi:hypothetical protein
MTKSKRRSFMAEFKVQDVYLLAKGVCLPGDLDGCVYRLDSGAGIWDGLWSRS